VGPVFFNLLGS